MTILFYFPQPVFNHIFFINNYPVRCFSITLALLVVSLFNQQGYPHCPQGKPMFSTVLYIFYPHI